MDYFIMFELLKFFLQVYEAYQNAKQSQKEKELAITVECLSQRLLKLEKSLQEKSRKD